MLKPLTMWITMNWKILKEMGIPDHLTCLLRNLYADQEATFRTKQETMDWFKIGKGVCKGCIFSSCLFNLYADSVQFSHSLMSNFLRPHRLQHDRLPYLSPTPRAFSNSCPSSWWCHLTIYLLLSPSPPAWRHQGLFQWVSSLHQEAKGLEFQLQNQSFQWIFRIDFF